MVDNIITTDTEKLQFWQDEGQKHQYSVLSFLYCFVNGICRHHILPGEHMYTGSDSENCSGHHVRSFELSGLVGFSSVTFDSSAELGILFSTSEVL